MYIIRKSLKLAGPINQKLMSTITKLKRNHQRLVRNTSIIEIIIIGATELNILIIDTKIKNTNSIRLGHLSPKVFERTVEGKNALRLKIK